MMNKISFHKQQLIPFLKLMNERNGRYIKQSIVASYSHEVDELYSAIFDYENNRISLKYLEDIVISRSEEEVLTNINEQIIHSDNVLFYKILSKNNKYNFIVHIFDKFSYVLTKKQIESNYCYINCTYNEDSFLYLDNVSKKINKLISESDDNNVFYLKNNGFIVVGNDYGKMLKEIDDVNRYFIDNYEQELYQKNTNGLLIKKELDCSKITLRDRQTLCLEMLRYFDKKCRENDIKYSLTGGTLLGAIRHGGLIPWDDDIDVFLTRPEYNKLNNVFLNKSDRYEFINNQIDKTYPFPFSRLIDKKTFVPDNPLTLYSGKGLYIDICCVDGLPKNYILRKLHILHMRALFRLRRSTIVGRRNKLKKKHKIKYYIKLLLNVFFSTEHWNTKLINNMDKYDFDSSDYVANLTSQYGERELLHKKGFDEYLDINFGDENYMIFSGYEEYLSKIYKNYLQLPKKNKRPDHKHEDAFWDLEDKKGQDI